MCKKNNVESIVVRHKTNKAKDIQESTAAASPANNCYVLGSDIALPDGVKVGGVSDGYHTFDELYLHRVRLFSTLMRAHSDKAWWSKKYSDGEVWEGWVLAGIDSPNGTLTYHLPDSEIPYLPVERELEFSKEWDGHTAEDVIERLLSL